MKFIKQTNGQFPVWLCEHLIQIFEDNDVKGKTYKGLTGGGSYDIKKKHSMDLELQGSAIGVDKKLFDNIESFLYPSLAEYLNMALPTAQGNNNCYTVEGIKRSFYLTQCPRLKRYRPPDEGFHAWHADSLEGNSVQRVLVAMVYLNDVPEGGETAFFHQGIKIRPRQGRMVIFPSGLTHVHRGLPPISNDKYICNFYIGKAKTPSEQCPDGCDKGKGHPRDEELKNEV